MSNAALVAVGAAHRRWTNALHARTVIGDRSFHIEPVHINIKTFFLAQVIGVLHGRAQQGKNVSCDTLLGERECGQRIFHPLAFDQIQHQPRLLRRNSGEPGFCFKFHRL